MVTDTEINLIMLAGVVIVMVLVVIILTREGKP